MCYIYMDDEALNAANLKVQLDKSEFLHKEVEFLGHIITSSRIKPNPQKVEAIKRFVAPTTIKMLHFDFIFIIFRCNELL